MKTTILSLGGSLIIPDEINVTLLQEFSALIRELIDTGEHRFVIFTGGGSVARIYMQGASEVTEISDAQRDWLGIHASRLNAQLVRTVFEDIADPEIIIDPTQERELTHAITIGAGWKPGWSTDYDAMEVAVRQGAARMVNLSNITHAYDKDPSEFDDAQPIEDIAWPAFRKIVGDKWIPGLNAPFDPIAAKLGEEHGIEVVIANGNDIENTRKIILGQDFTGTLVHA